MDGWRHVSCCVGWSKRTYESAIDTLMIRYRSERKKTEVTMLAARENHTSKYDNMSKFPRSRDEGHRYNTTALVHIHFPSRSKRRRHRVCGACVYVCAPRRLVVYVILKSSRRHRVHRCTATTAAAPWRRCRIRSWGLGQSPA